MRTFKLHRSSDASGFSGTGVVAEGVQFSNGRCVMVWIKDSWSVTVYEDIGKLLAIHGHQGDSHIAWD